MDNIVLFLLLVEMFCIFLHLIKVDLLQTAFIILGLSDVTLMSLYQGSCSASNEIIMLVGFQFV